MRTMWMAFIAIGVPVVLLGGVAMAVVGLVAQSFAPTPQPVFGGGPVSCQLQQDGRLLVAIVPLGSDAPKQYVEYTATGAAGLALVKYGWLPGSVGLQAGQQRPTVEQLAKLLTERSSDESPTKSGTFVLAAPVEGPTDQVRLGGLALVISGGEVEYAQNLSLDIHVTDGRCAANTGTWTGWGTPTPFPAA